MVADCYGLSDPDSGGADSCRAKHRGLLGTTAIDGRFPLKVDTGSVSEPSLAARDSGLAKPTIVSCHFRYAKQKMWDKGVRLLCPKGKKFVAFVQNAVKTGLKITEVRLVQISLPYCCKVVESKLGTLWHNQVSSYRSALKKCKFYRDCGLLAVFSCELIHPSTKPQSRGKKSKRRNVRRGNKSPHPGGCDGVACSRKDTGSLHRRRKRCG